MLYTLSFVLPFWNERPRRIPKWMMVGYILLLVGCILLTGSRAAFMGLCLLGFMLLVSSMKRKLQAMLLGAVVAFVGFVVLTVALPEDLQNRYLTILDSSRGPANAQTSAQGRIDGIMWGFYLFGQSPFNGYGPGSFVYCTGKGLQPHNLYGQVLSEMGLLGGLALIGLLLCYWRNVREVRRLAETGASKPSMSFALQVTRAAGFNLVLLLALGCGGHNLYRYNWQWFAAFTAIAVCCARKQTATAETWEYAGHAPRPQFA
jgi:O-antigen ligase